MIYSNNRIVLFGKTGSGKTFITKHVLWHQYGKRKIFFDPKCENYDLPGVRLARNPRVLEQLVLTGKTVLYQPDDLCQDDFHEVCGTIFDTGNYVLFCDEVTDVCSPAPHGIAKNHRRILAQGRSRGVGVVSCSTRPRDCHSSIISEAEHFFIFRLVLETDVVKIRTMLPPLVSKKIHILPLHYFLYFNTSDVIKFFKPFEIKGT